ncbi:Rhodanese-like protein [Natrinema pellirubrum DSM 15624]|uniref:Rhodanese-like protein n=1 Tax=Natrinema pellirubrum (strain DSM 15624 / CIP 106293 / JCM 10476 / NCIMB 786 / 157) TaxID=797303 RepID=L0JPN3_NATP1|nr:sulfurtransferase [Natrinema pellirubrum]AGB33485.1 rhodanese-related sulfurtransferase [Natrinema pellirubrum DSM 15624]ELY70716.1 Rhodanese-like protein [Natrinema pellirubrum DSM 15624]
MDESVVVSPDWLASRLDDPAVRVVDVRDAWEFDGIGHVPGAVSIPFDSYRDESDVDRGTLPGADAFATLLGDAGISPDDTIVAYDDTHGVFAARFVLTALEYGHDDVRLLDGDYSAWNQTYETTSDTPEIDPVDYEADPLEPDESPLVGYDAVEAALERDAVFVDTREREEFEEARLPGAVRFDWRDVIDDETRRLKPEDELEALLADRGITPDREIVLYCNTARRISHTYVVLTALGYEDVMFYEGSLTEWLANDGETESGPVSTE